MEHEPINLKPVEGADPINLLAAQLLKDVILFKDDGFVLELNVEQHKKTEKEMAALEKALKDKTISIDRYLFLLERLPNSVNVIYLNGEKTDSKPSMSGFLFGNIANVFLLAAGIPFWTKGKISGAFETINPASKWLIESSDLSCRIELKRVQITL